MSLFFFKLGLALGSADHCKWYRKCWTRHPLPDQTRTARTVVLQSIVSFSFCFAISFHSFNLPVQWRVKTKGRQNKRRQIILFIACSFRIPRSLRLSCNHNFFEEPIHCVQRIIAPLPFNGELKKKYGNQISRRFTRPWSGGKLWVRGYKGKQFSLVVEVWTLERWRNAGLQFEGVRPSFPCPAFRKEMQFVIKFCWKV